jgi:acetoin:2,6-dichlorophenolindophenol oxidoreductase subunit beta
MVTATQTRVMTYGEAVNDAMRTVMREDPTVILMGEDVAGGADIDHLINEDAWGGPMGVTKGLVQEFGRNRILDTPITESGFIGAAVGAASTGLRPIAELMFVDFSVAAWTRSTIRAPNSGTCLVARRNARS